MARNSEAQVVLKAKDDTKSAFDSIGKSLDGAKVGFTNLEEHTSGKLLSLQSKLVGVASAFAAFSGLSYIAEKFKGVIEAGEQLDILSKKSGMTVEDLSKLKFAAKYSGVEFTDATKTIQKFTLTIAEAANGSEKAQAKIKSAGLSKQDALDFKNGTLSMADALVILGEKTANMNIADKTKVFQDNMGKTGMASADMVAHFKELGEEATKLGLIMSSDFAKNSHDLIDNLGKIKEKGIKGYFEEALPAVTSLSEALLIFKESTVKGKKGQEDLVAAQVEWIQFIGGSVLPAIDSIINGYNNVKAAGTILVEYMRIAGREMSAIWTETSSSIGRSLSTVFSIIGSIGKANDAMGELTVTQSGKRAQIASNFLAEAGEAFNKQGQLADEAKNKSLRRITEIEQANIKSFAAIAKAAAEGGSKNSNITGDYLGIVGKNTEEQTKIRLAKIQAARNQGGAVNGDARDLSKGGGKSKLIKNEYEAAIKELEFQLKEELKTLARNDQEISLYYSNNLKSTKDFYDQKRANLLKSNSETERILTEELRIINAQKGKAKPEDLPKLKEKEIEVETRLRDVKLDAGNKILAMKFEEQKANENFIKTANSMYANLLEGEGKYIEAIKLRLELENSDLKKKAKAEGNQKLSDAIDKTERLKSVTAGLTEYEKKSKIAKEEGAIAEEYLSIKKNKGLIGEIDYLKQLGDIRVGQAGKIKEQIDLMNGLDKASMTQDQILELKKLELEYAKFGETLNPLKDQLDQLFNNGFSTFFQNVLGGNKSLKASFKDLFSSITKGITDLVSKQLSTTLMNQIMPSGGGGIGGFFSNLLGGASGSGGGNSSGGGMMSGLSSFFGGLFADGGYTDGSKPILVGERGPEIFRPSGSGSISNNKDSAAMLGNGGHTYNVQFTVNAKDAASFNHSKDQIMGDLHVALNRASNRNN